MVHVSMPSATQFKSSWLHPWHRCAGDSRDGDDEDALSCHALTMLDGLSLSPPSSYHPDNQLGLEETPNLQESWFEITTIV